MSVDEKILDRCMSNILDHISAGRLKKTGIEKLEDVFDRRWLIEWFKQGCPVMKDSYYYKKQKLAKIAYESILEEEEFLVVLDESDCLER